jgi:hypothetical protein
LQIQILVIVWHPIDGGIVSGSTIVLEQYLGGTGIGQAAEEGDRNEKSSFIHNNPVPCEYFQITISSFSCLAYSLDDNRMPAFVNSIKFGPLSEGFHRRP